MHMVSRSAPSLAKGEFLANSDNAIHRELSQRAHELARHPLLVRLADGLYSPAVVAWAYRRRKAIVDTFMPLLSQARSMAEMAARPELTRALTENICDENGLDPVSGLPTGRGSHHEWAEWFIAALNEVDPPGNSACEFTRLGFPLWDPYPTTSRDSLALIVGMLMAAEKCIAIEYRAFLDAFTTAFPALVDGARPERLLLFVDHIEHDEQRHLPDLIDGFLGRLPGSKGYAVQVDQSHAVEALDLVAGMDRVLSVRRQFYDQLLEITGDPA
ncbi:MAG: hypothetical protein NTY67_04275 [Cyanobacteria bacterium]|nr:hypothetical protein [Cyanobacteriota bacterium]